jgi:hypothetical protein
VLVVRLVAQHTIEEHILQVAEEKRKFADSSITGEQAGWFIFSHCLPIIMTTGCTLHALRSCSMFWALAAACQPHQTP